MAPAGIVMSPAGASKRTAASVLSPSPQKTATTNDNSIILPHDIPSSPNKRAKFSESSLAGAMVAAMDCCGISSKEKMEECVVGLLEQIRKAPNGSNAEQVLACVRNGPKCSSKNRTGKDTNNSTSSAVLVDMTAQVENIPPAALNNTPTTARNLGFSLAAEASINRKAFEVKLFPDGSLVERTKNAAAVDKFRAVDDMEKALEKVCNERVLTRAWNHIPRGIPRKKE